MKVNSKRKAIWWLLLKAENALKWKEARPVVAPATLSGKATQKIRSKINDMLKAA